MALLHFQAVCKRFHIKKTYDVVSYDNKYLSLKYCLTNLFYKMAVKPKRIKERIKALYPKANLSQSRINALSVKLSKKPAEDAEDDDLDDLINDFNEIYSFTQIAKEDDQKRSTEKKIADLENEEEEEEEDPGETKGKGKGKPKKEDEIPGWAQKLIDQNKKLSDEVEGFKAQSTKDLKSTEARKVFESSEAIKKLPEQMQKRLFKTLDLNDEENTIEDQIVEMEEEFADFTNASPGSDEFSPKPPNGTGGKGPSEKEIEDIVEHL